MHHIPHCDMVHTKEFVSQNPDFRVLHRDPLALLVNAHYAQSAMTTAMEDCPHGLNLLKVFGGVALALATGASWYGILERVDLGLGGTMLMYNVAWMAPTAFIGLMRAKV